MMRVRLGSAACSGVHGEGCDGDVMKIPGGYLGWAIGIHRHPPLWAGMKSPFSSGKAAYLRPISSGQGRGGGSEDGC